MASKQPYGNGTVYHRASDGLYVGAVLIDGKRRVVYGKTAKEAEAKRAKLQAARDANLPVADGKLTLARYLTDWLPSVKPDLRPRSYVRYEDAIRLQIVPALGKTPLAKLTPLEIKAWQTSLSATLAPATVARAHAVLRKALNDAVRHQIIARNVASIAGGPRVPKTEMHPWSPEEAATFLRAVQGDPLEAFYALAINTGMRRGELLGLHWADVHTEGEEPYVQVRYTLQDEKDGRFTFAPPKTEQSARRVPLNRTAIAALRRHKARQNAQRLAAGDAWQDTRGLVFTTALGTPLRGNHILQRDFEPKVKRLGLPRIRLHDLRHTTATLLFAQGYSIEDVARILGHSSTTVTSTVYVHVPAARLRAATASLDRLFA